MLSVLLSFSLSVVLVPLSFGVSRLLGAMDIPRDHRRMHGTPLPRGGGVGILAAVLLSFPMLRFQMEGAERLHAILLGTGLILLLGLMDDAHPIDAKIKLAVELLVGGVTLWCGMGIRGWGWPLSLLWVTCICNVHNLIDGMDGLFAGTAAIESAFLVGLLWMRGDVSNASLALLLAGALVGFWIFNRHPAFLFAGDGGALSVGFLLGLLSLSLFQGAGEWSFFFSPVLLFAHPLADLAAAMGRRLLRGGRLFRADRGHLHHRIFDAGLEQKQTVRVLHTLSLTGGLTAFLPMLDNGISGISALGCFLAAAVLVGCRKYVGRFQNKG